MYLYSLIKNYVIKTYQLDSRNKLKNSLKQVNLFYLFLPDIHLKNYMSIIYIFRNLNILRMKLKILENCKNDMLEEL
jgi:hypothetical protein